MRIRYNVRRTLHHRNVTLTHRTTPPPSIETITQQSYYMVTVSIHLFSLTGCRGVQSLSRNLWGQARKQHWTLTLSQHKLTFGPREEIRICKGNPLTTKREHANRTRMEPWWRFKARSQRGEATAPSTGPSCISVSVSVSEIMVTSHSRQENKPQGLYKQTKHSASTDINNT